MAGSTAAVLMLWLVCMAGGAMSQKFITWTVRLKMLIFIDLSAVLGAVMQSSLLQEWCHLQRR